MTARRARLRRRCVIDMPPPNPPLGFVWRPKAPKPKGPMAGAKTASGYELTGMAEGLIRVVKVCRDCGTERDAWMFLPIHRKVMRELAAAREESDEERPHFVGVGGWCDPCLERDDNNRTRRKLEQDLEAVQKRWEVARNERELRPVAYHLKRILGGLIDTVTFGGEKFSRYTARLQIIETWLGEHRSDHAA